MMHAKSSKLWSTSLLAAMFALVCGVPAVHGNQISFYRTVFDTDFVTAGTGGLRGTGSGTITVGGVAGTADLSYLYWHGPTNSSAANVNATVTVNDADLIGSNIGFSHDNLWSMDNSQTYRAESSSVINQNGAYTLSNFAKPPDVEVNGSAAILFFRDDDTSNDRDVVILDGNDSNFASDFDPAGWSFQFNGINYSTGVARLTLFITDGQNLGSEDDGTLRVNGTDVASGGLFQGDSLPGGAGPLGNGNLFDVETFDITALLTPGINNLNVTFDEVSKDGSGLIAALVDLPAGAAPPVNPVPEPGTVQLIGVGVILAALCCARRRRRR